MVINLLMASSLLHPIHCGIAAFIIRWIAGKKVFIACTLVLMGRGVTDVALCAVISRDTQYCMKQLAMAISINIHVCG